MADETKSTREDSYRKVFEHEDRVRPARRELDEAEAAAALGEPGPILTVDEAADLFLETVAVAVR